MSSFNSIGSRGLSLLELMIGLAVLVFLLTLAGNSVKSISAHSDIKANTSEVMQAFRTAQHAARLASTSVTAEIELAEDNSNFIISFSFGDHRAGDENVNQAANGLRLEAIELSDRVLVMSDTLDFTFDSFGMVDKTGVISLISTLDSEYESTVIVYNDMGHMTSFFSTPTKKES